MKKYLISKIIMSVEAIILIAILIFIKKENYTFSTLSVVTNNNLKKSLDIKVIQENQNELSLTKEEIDFVCRCIETHMGPWTTNYKGEEVLTPPKDKYQRFVHMCDYLASRKFLDINFNNNEIVD